MDRINGSGTVDIGGGRRGWRDENIGAGVEGTELTALWLNMVQEEILKIIEQAGLTANPGDWTQLYQAIGILLDALFADVEAAYVFATSPEAIAGVIVNKIISPKTLADVLTARIATQAETDGGTVANKFLVPSVMRNIFRFYDAEMLGGTALPSDVYVNPALKAPFETNLVDSVVASTAKMTVGSRDAGVWLVAGMIQYPGSGNNKSLRIHKNGVATSYNFQSRIAQVQNGVGQANDTFSVTAMVRLNAGDIITCDVLHSIGTTLTVTQGRFTATRIAL
jgi:hypothetical protein